jgi:hypothetical protein
MIASLSIAACGDGSRAEQLEPERTVERAIAWQYAQWDEHPRRLRLYYATRQQSRPTRAILRSNGRSLRVTLFERVRLPSELVGVQRCAVVRVKNRSITRKRVLDGAASRRPLSRPDRSILRYIRGGGRCRLVPSVVVQRGR